MTTTYQGHLADGSSVQKHSAGGAYHYVLVLRDSRRPGAKFDWGLVGPGINNPIWLKSSAGWDAVVHMLKLGTSIGAALLFINPSKLV